jgi:hypothetical protein
MIRHLTVMASALVALWSSTDAALACACCSNRGTRYVAVEALDDSRRVQIERMAFAEEAFLAEGTADDVQDLGTRLQLIVTQTGKEMVFAFHDQADRTTRLVLAIPDTISIFEVDPFGDEKDEGLGPVLYKEWQLTADAHATGALRRLVESGPKVTLIFHGRGRGCTEATHFTDWSLQIRGQAGNLTLYGALTSAR